MRVLFLDIDGVLKPVLSGWSEKKCTAESLYEEHRLKFESVGFDYPKMMKTGGDFQKRTIKNAMRNAGENIDLNVVSGIKKILDETDAKIVVSSNWREGGYPLIRALLSMFGLHPYIVGMTSFCCPVFRTPESEEKDWTMHEEADAALEKVGKALAEKYKLLLGHDYMWVRNRIPEIMDYLARHQEVTSYAVVDDEDYIETIFGPHGVETHYKLKEDQYERLRSALILEDGPYRFEEIDLEPSVAAWHKKWDLYHDFRMEISNERVVGA